MLWDDRKIGTGDDWYPELKNAMAHAAVAVCLISADFLASDFVNKEEIPFLLERRREHGMLLLPILLSPCPWQTVEWLRNIQIFPDPKKPLETMSTEVEQKQAFADIAVEIYNKISDAEYELPVSSPAWVELAKDRIDTDRLPRTGTEIFGRAEQLALLDEAWDSETTNIVSFVAWGGVGKSALVNKWVEKLGEDNYRGAQRVYAWSFYSQGTHERITSADMFIDMALRWFGDAEFANTTRSGWDKGQRLAEHVQEEKTLLLLDGLEPLQSGFEHDRGQVKDPALRVLIEELAKKNPGLCVISTREDLVGLADFSDHIVRENLDQISDEAGRSLLRIREIRGTDQQLEQATND
ncbi:MAG: toll/interleukin-1 receptor domain-containing protein, partial [Planctomycetes bacterium]|nr:toll/interleukin-1 receptor domain-containing protein [Planctomycetota bacterium]